MTLRAAGRSRGWRVAVWRALPAVLWAVLIFAFSAQSDLPRAPQSMLDVLVKKGGHLTEYAVLAVLIHHALGAAVGDARRTAPVAWALAVLYATTDELHQAFVPGRRAALSDVAIDGMGALLGLAALLALRRLRTPPQPPSSTPPRAPCGQRRPADAAGSGGVPPASAPVP